MVSGDLNLGLICSNICGSSSILFSDLGTRTLSWDLNFVVFPITLRYVLDEYPAKVPYQGLVPRVTLGGDNIYIYTYIF